MGELNAALLVSCAWCHAPEPKRKMLRYTGQWFCCIQHYHKYLQLQLEGGSDDEPHS